MPEDNDIGLDFDALRRLAELHDSSVRLRTRDGRVIDITRDTLPEDILAAAGKSSVDNHDRVGVRVGDHDRITNIHDRSGRAVQGLGELGNPGRPPIGIAGEGVFLSGLDERQLNELREKASDLLSGRTITLFKDT